MGTLLTLENHSPKSHQSPPQKNKKVMISGNKLRDEMRPPEGVKAFLSEYKLPLTVSGLAVLAVILYGRFG